jgi:hypothetical protein
MRAGWLRREWWPFHFLPWRDAQGRVVTEWIRVWSVPEDTQ